MAWVRFTAPFRWVPPAERRVSIRYRPGPYSVTKACADAAVAAKAATRIKTPKRGAAPPSDQGGQET